MCLDIWVLQTTARHLGLGSTPPALFSVLLPFQWSSGEILPAAIDVKALVSVQQFCWVLEGDVYGFLDEQTRLQCPLCFPDVL